MAFIQTYQAVWGLAALLFVVLVRFLQRFRFQRGLVKGLPGPPHHPIFGHLLVFGEISRSAPVKIHPHTLPHLIKEKYGIKSDVFYLDLWPIAPDAQCVLTSPDLANQVTVKTSLPKHQSVVDFMQHIGGSTNMASTEGSEWRKTRSMFNPGFAASHLMSLVPGIVRHVEVFAEILAEHAKNNDVFRLEEAGTRLTVDIIGEVVMDINLNSQRSENEMVNAFRNQIEWLETTHPGIDLLRKQNPLYWAVRRVVFTWNTWTMERYISKILDARFAARDSSSSRTKKVKHVVDIALDSYTAEDKGADGGYDRRFKQNAMDQIRTFIFAGHDTTSSTICYIYHLLSKHPEEMAKVRKEHDDVFGSDSTNAAALINADPHLLNKLDYSLAVIKEVLRLYPAASTVRKGEKGVFITDPKTGVQYPTENFMVWSLHVASHRNANIWDEPDRFKPERFLSKPGEPAPAYTNAWRPFEKGPRNCIGQELAILETRIIMVLTLRTFDIKAAYGDLKLLRNDGSSWPNDEEGVQEVFGDEAYQVLLATAKPREGMPARVTMRGNENEKEKK